MRLLVVLWVLGLATLARADDVDDLVGRGEALAKQGEYTMAISAFKAADARHPRAKHACLIGLAYTRRESWPQAELFLRLCRARATADDPVPKWLDDAQRELAAKLTAAGAAAVTIEVSPTVADAKLTVSSFAPDEVFAPQTIHLAPGRHTIHATAKDYVSVSRELVVTDATPQTVTIEMRSNMEAAVPPLPIAPLPPPVIERLVRAPPRSSVPLVVIAGGLALGLAGGAYDLLVVAPARTRLAASPDNAVYDEREGEFDTRRDVTIGLYAGAVIAVATGIVLRYAVLDRERLHVAVGAAVGPGAGMLTVAWQPR